jgi:predicted nucleotidyltransferase
MMAGDSPIIDLRQKATELYPLSAGTEWFVFGSFARGSYTESSDIDLLIVYQDGKMKDMLGISDMLERDPKMQLLDVLFLSVSEEREVQFALKEEAIHIWPTKP